MRHELELATRAPVLRRPTLRARAGRRVRPREEQRPLVTLTGDERSALWIGMKDAEAGHSLPGEPRGQVAGLWWLIRALIVRPAPLLADPHLDSLRRLGLRLARASRVDGTDVNWGDLLAKARIELTLRSPPAPGTENSQ